MLKSGGSESPKPVIWIDLARLVVNKEGTVAVFCFEKKVYTKECAFTFTKAYHERVPGEEVWEKAGTFTVEGGKRFIRCVPCGNLSLEVPQTLVIKENFIEYFKEFNAKR